MRVTDAYTNRKVVTNWEISADDIRRALNLPADARIFVRVPGGGDWSNTDLEIDDDTPLRARAVG